ncbi:hypothetical protein [Polaribacter sargassicola]|uniref:hypothetical protein n=1 Tax=Polaribacter sargassicola TaxID=2836891 RepID=UPI001F1E631F|nr:hypothetical protein [Polaribacter sp. DS7-9]MCG1036192.1 hypothetical protein [Polaribacter sp. DS7-9]
MKKLILTITVAILTSGVSATSLENKYSKNFNKVVAVVTNSEFKEIALKELPDAVVDSILEDFAAAIVTKAFVNDQHQYKIKFMIDDETKSFVYADEKGNWLNKRKVKDL